MNKNLIIPVITFVIGGGIGCVCGVKGFASYFKHYLRSDECKDYLDKRFEKLWNDMIQEIRY